MFRPLLRIGFGALVLSTILLGSIRAQVPTLPDPDGDLILTPAFLPKEPPTLQLVQDIEAPTAQITPTAPTAPIAPPVPAASAAQAAPPSGGSSNTVQVSGVGGGASPGGGGQATSAAAVNAPDLGGLLAKSETATGVEISRRNAIVSDARIRGLRNGQYLSLGDSAPYFPGRLDLDTPVSKFYPAMVRSIDVIRGPYTTLLGPGFAFLNIQTIDSPRSKNGGTEYSGTTSAGYQTNGAQWNGLQVVNVAGADYGFRASYNILQGSDYRDGNGEKIPSSYQSNNFNLAAGFDLYENLNFEFKALKTFQNNLEFPGLFFDIDTSDAEAYSIRLTAKDFGPFDVFTTDLWYNATTGTGNTRADAKQRFVNNQLAFAFEDANNQIPGRPGAFGYAFEDLSTTRYAQRSIGYRFAGQWGNNTDQPTLTVGTDLNAAGQGLVENILFRQTAGPDLTSQLLLRPSGSTEPPFFQQTQSIPNSNSVDTGLFLEGFVPITNDLKFKSGTRMDYVRTSSNPRLITGNVDLFGGSGDSGLGFNRGTLDPAIYSFNQNQTDLDREFLLLAGFATLEYSISKELQVFAQYGYAERAPTLTELYSAGPFVGVLQQGTSRLIGDPSLSKERTNQFDVGVRYDSEYFRAGARGFYSFINNYITYDANRISNGGLSQVVFTNTNLATLAGTEFYLQADVNRWLSPFATLSYVQGIDQTHVDRRRNPGLASSRRRDPATRAFATDTEPLPQIPPLETRLGFRIHGTDPQPKWQIELSTRIVSGQNSVASSLGELATPGFTTVDLRGFWQARENLLFTAGVENIGDRLYREHLDPISSNVLRATTRNTTVPVLFRPGFNFFFNTQLTY